MVSCQPQPQISLLVIDDHELTRLALKVLFSQQENIEIVGLASNGQEGIELVQQHIPDVIILDLQMPVMNGLTAATQIKLFAPKTKIIAYSSFEDPQTEVMVQTAPIDAFCQKEIPTESLIELVNQLAEKEGG